MRLARLIRFPAGLTAVADVLAGHGLAGGGLSLAILPLAGASFCLYSAGMALNDVADRDRDRQRAPDRPIPSGSLSAFTAALVGVALLAAGLLSAFLAGWRPLAVAGVLAFLVASYDFAWKRRRLPGMLAMAACRATNLVLGASLAGLAATPVLGGAAALIAYTFFLTGASQAEDQPVGVAWKTACVAGMLAALFAAWWLPGAGTAALLPLVAAAALLLARWPALARGAAGSFVGAAVLAIPLLDAGLLLAAGRVTLALACVGLFVVSLAFRRAKIG